MWFFPVSLGKLKYLAMFGPIIFSLWWWSLDYMIKEEFGEHLTIV